MSDPIQIWLKDLANERAGWVTRRDAAEALGDVARRACEALGSHLEDADTDVRSAVAAALSKVKRPEIPPDADAPPSLAALARSMAKTGRREVIAEGEGFVVVVTLPGERQQRVLLSTFVPTDGRTMLRIHTWCGEEQPEVLAWLLKNNGKLSHCAFALLDDAGISRIALVKNMPLADAAPEPVKKAVKEIAHYGDWLESKITESDIF